MNILKKSLVGAACIGVLFGLAACGNKKTDGKDSTDGKSELSLTTWNYDAEHASEFRTLVEAFEKEYPDIKIKTVDSPSADYETKLTTMLSSNDTTDVLTMQNLSMYSNYASHGQLLDLTDHIKTIDIKPAQAGYDMYEMDGKTYAQPYRNDFYVLYYNKKMFDEAGIEYPNNITWDQYEEIAKKLSKPNEQIYGAYLHTWNSVIQSIAAAQNDANLLKPSYGIFEDYYDRALRMQKDKSQMDFGTVKSSGITYDSMFEAGKTGMFYMGTWVMSNFATDSAAGKTDLEWGIAPIPQKEAGANTTFGAPTGFAINKNAKHKKEAQKFVDFCTGEKGAAALAGIGIVPAYRTDEVNKAFFGIKGMPNDELTKDGFSPKKIVIDFPVSANSSAISKILTEEHALIMTGDETPKKGIKNMEKRVEEEVK